MYRFVLVIIMGFIPICLSAESNRQLYKSDFEVDSIFYTIHEDGVYVSAESAWYDSVFLWDYYSYDTVKASASYHGDVLIPQTVSFLDTIYTVVGIESYAFKSCSGLQSVTIPETVRLLGEECFYGCANMDAISLPESLQRIEQRAFWGCRKLRELLIPDGVEFLGDNFMTCCTNLTRVVIPEKIQELTSTNTLELTLPRPVLLSAPNVVGSESNLKLFDYKNHVRISDGEIVLYKKGFQSLTYMPKEIVAMSGDGTFSLRFGADVDSIPDMFVNNLRIKSAFTRAGTIYSFGSSICDIIFNDSVSYIGKQAFRYFMTLTGLTIPESVELIADSAFYYCTSLNKVLIKGNPEIAPTAFLDCGTELEIIKTGINVIDADHHEVYESVHYGTDGRLISPDAPGFHIVRMPDGRMRKALILSK